ncbi:MAG: MarR family transcriptional regulator [Rhizobium sp.]|nr:MAG: MarR family transcriptional regulator [Rhizobium sp.]
MPAASSDRANEVAFDSGDAIPPYSRSIAGTLLAAREAVMAPLRIRLRNAHFTEAQWRVLRVLAERGKSDGRTIARAALLHPPSVTRIIQELAKRGLISRQPDGHDGRRHSFDITQDGHEIVTNAAHFNRCLVTRYRDGFGSERLDALLHELRAFTQLVLDERVNADDLGAAPASRPAVAARNGHAKHPADQA